MGRQTLPAPEPLTLEQLTQIANQNRREEKRKAKQDKISMARSSARVCWRCGFGALKGISYSNLVKMKDNEGNITWGHAQPTVCAGAVRAITSQTRMTIKEALIDFVNVSWLSFKGSRLYRFLTEELSNEYRRGPRIRENTRVKS